MYTAVDTLFGETGENVTTSFGKARPHNYNWKGSSSSNTRNDSYIRSHFWCRSAGSVDNRSPCSCFLACCTSWTCFCICFCTYCGSALFYAHCIFPCILITDSSTNFRSKDVDVPQRCRQQYFRRQHFCHLRLQHVDPTVQLGQTQAMWTKA